MLKLFENNKWNKINKFFAFFMISAIDVDDVLQRRSIRVLIETLARFEWKMQLKRTEFLIASASCKKSK